MRYIKKFEDKELFDEDIQYINDLAFEIKDDGRISLNIKRSKRNYKDIVIDMLYSREILIGDPIFINFIETVIKYMGKGFKFELTKFKSNIGRYKSLHDTTNSLSNNYYQNTINYQSVIAKDINEIKDYIERNKDYNLLHANLIIYCD